MSDSVFLHENNDATASAEWKEQYYANGSEQYRPAKPPVFTKEQIKKFAEGESDIRTDGHNLRSDERGRFFYLPKDHPEYKEHPEPKYAEKSNNYSRNCLTFARLFYFESEQARICKYLNSISIKSIEGKINSNDIPRPFGKQFIIGPEVYNINHTGENRYYALHFIDDVTDATLCARGLKSGILEVNKTGQLTILDGNFRPMSVNSRFTFENRNLELHTHGWLDYINQSRKTSLVTRCIGAASLVVAAGISYAAYK